MKSLSKIALSAGIALSLCLGSFSVQAQKRPPAPPRQENLEGKNAPKPKPNNANNGANRPGNIRQMEGLPPKAVEKLRDMPPEQQERWMNNNERFRNMTPQQQAQIRRNLQNWNNLTPDQRQEMRERERVLEEMTPAQRQYIRQTLVPQWKSMPPGRRQVMLQHLQQLRGLDDAQRETRLNDPAFVSGLSPDEQNMLRNLSRLRVGSNPEVPPGY
jgi:hypothetical protein